MTLFPKTINYESESGGYFDDNTGKWVDGVPVVESFQGSVQPMSGKEIESFPWLRQDTGHVKVYSDILLDVSTQGGDTKGAVVIWQDQKWEVVHQLKFQNDLINHYKFIAEFRDEA